MLAVAHKYISNYKCQCYRAEKCNCAHKKDANAIFLENINDIAGSLAEVMMICGIHQVKARASGQVVIHAFLHYDEIRHRIDVIPYKRFCREDVMMLLAKKCLMNRLEAQLAYSIMKRAFKAFYHGTGVGGIKNPILEAQLLHTQECFWVHAAKRTAQVFANYEGLFLSAQKYYESKILCVYKDLYERLKARTDPLVLNECECTDCVRRKITLPRNSGRNSKKEESATPERRSSEKTRRSCTQDRESSVADSNASDKRVSGRAGSNDEARLSQRVGFDSTVRESKVSLNLPHCYNCNCPKLICECDVHVDTGVLSAECSQGPFICRWVRDDGEEKLDPCILIPENHQCPVDCYEVSYECDAECDCDCDECECPSDEGTVSIYLDYDYTDQMDRILEEVEEEATEPEFQPKSIDMTPMHLRRPHPLFGCCRVAPTPAEKKKLEELMQNQMSNEETVVRKSSTKQSMIKRGSRRSSVNSTSSKLKSKRISTAATTPTTSPKKATKISTILDAAESENIKEIIKGLF